jgi:alkyl hydroperoxide reductase subunit F
MYDLIIIGGGPAGVAAGVYASRKKIKTLFLTESFGGQSIVSDGIENWIGTVKISGSDLAKNLEEHLRAYAGETVEIKTHTRVGSIEKTSLGFKVTKQGSTEVYESKTILIATGSKRRKLEATGADTYEHKGLTYCATCDAPMFGGQDVVVVGGGNAAFESAAQLAAHCTNVTILNRSESFRADPVTVEKVLAKENVTAITHAVVDEVFGSKFVEGLTYKETTSGELKKLAITGIFVEIGLIPNTDFVKDIVTVDQYGKVVIDHKTQSTTTTGIWSAGDCTDGLYHQNNIAAGDAVKALEDIYVYLTKN